MTHHRTASPHHRRQHNMQLSGRSADALASGLGWFSIALGALELLAPRGLARGLGMPGQENLIRAYGAREIATGIGILSSRDRTPWIWGRIGGDALDIATLSTAMRDSNPQRGNALLALAAVAGVTALDVICAQALTSRRSQPALPVPDYSDRSGLPRPADAMRGAARDFKAPRDMRIPEAMRPYAQA